MSVWSLAAPDQCPTLSQGPAQPPGSGDVPCVRPAKPSPAQPAQPSSLVTVWKHKQPIICDAFCSANRQFRTQIGIIQHYSNVISNASTFYFNTSYWDWFFCEISFDIFTVFEKSHETCGGCSIVRPSRGWWGPGPAETPRDRAMIGSPSPAAAILGCCWHLDNGGTLGPGNTRENTHSKHLFRMKNIH